MAGFTNVAFGERVLDRSSLTPQIEMGRCGSIWGPLDSQWIEFRNAHNAGEFAQDITRIATGMAGHQYSAIALPDRQRWCPVVVSGA